MPGGQLEFQRSDQGFPSLHAFQAQKSFGSGGGRNVVRVHIAVGLSVDFLAAGEELVFPHVSGRGAGAGGVCGNMARLVFRDAGVQDKRLFFF